MTIDESFRPWMGEIDVDSLDKSPDPIYIVDAAFALRGYNRAYVDFARTNGVPDPRNAFGIGSNLLSMLPSALRDFYVKAYTEAMTERTIFEHDYECSSDLVFRLFHQTAYPFTEVEALLVSNHCVAEYAHTDPSGRLSGAHLDKHGFIQQCANCRKIRDHTVPDKWDWIASALVDHLPNVSHSVCSRCLDFYYSQAALDRYIKRG